MHAKNKFKHNRFIRILLQNVIFKRKRILIIHNYKRIEEINL